MPTLVRQDARNWKYVAYGISDAPTRRAFREKAAQIGKWSGESAPRFECASCHGEWSVNDIGASFGDEAIGTPICPADGCLGIGWDYFTEIPRFLEGMAAVYRPQIEELVTYAGHGGGEVEAYLSRPTDQGPHPAMVLLHHAPAWDESSIEMTRKLAHHGYATISPHLYSREGKGASPQDAAAAVRAAGGTPDDQMLGDVAAAVAYLRAQPYTTGKVGVIGFCSGGRQTYMAACRLDIDAAVDCWGGSVDIEPSQLTDRHPIAPIDMTADMRCPILGIFGSDDYNPSAGQVARIEAALKEHGKNYEFHLYEGAGHSFFTTDEANYRVEQAKDGWRRVFDFLGRVLA